MANFSIIITAGGIGKRMQSDIPKQFIEVNGLPILMHTIKRFYDFDKACEIILTLPEDWLIYWSEIRIKYNFNVTHHVVTGGVERYDSIKNALKHCHSEIIGVHDGVRPLVSKGTIERCLTKVSANGAVIPMLPLKESIRKVEGNSSTALDRKLYFSVQTPQFFQKEIIEKAYEQPFHERITDDASLVEEAGFEIDFVEGNEENIKITTPIDLKIINLFI
ncbi:2-C-methyl-D-erythritol 4-phosphate cytidylyltransferase [Crocinitomicaceae bacterium]|nr:2-C-methyl-D-erythritol 4-phosphate cytidylyltransferase [Crocinitomicaceae bacterium]